MRFDLTVPFARFMAAHLHELYLPFKRYHMAKAFRGENTQRGRYREFMQCDFDIVGTDSVSADFEILAMIRHAFGVMGVDGVELHVSHRGIFNRLLEALDCAAASDEVLRTVDKLRKIGEKKVRASLAETVGEAAAEKIMAFVQASGSNDSIVRQFKELVPSASREIARLERLLEIATSTGNTDIVVIDPSITRGLDYYTGIVFETFLKELPDLGSVCSGGRYDNLASLYTKQELPGVGASIGIDRLMAGLEELGVAGGTERAADCMVLCLDAAHIATYQKRAQELRELGVRTDVFPEPKKLGQQFAVAETKGIPAAVIIEGEDLERETMTVRNLATRENTDGIGAVEAARHIGKIVAT
jgi:histidyl-tRNA synthetase